MYKIEHKPFGFKLQFGGTIGADEMKSWVTDSKKELAGRNGKFGVLVDMINLKPLAPDAQELMVAGQKEYKAKGMERSAVGVANAVIALQFKRLAQESGIYQWERYIDASKSSAWEKIAEAWIVNGIDPDK
ncbi:MAG TPA: hypothetical protein VEO56_00505 [Bacteroidota bacterium]|nr:hypothetical protein [Bacteroidota bacterium]